jgi:dolichyl-diphosphooligosaccharide--protein glycosyltransferase
LGEKLGKVTGALTKLGNLRPKISHSTLMTTIIISLILLIAFVLRILPIRWGMYLSEFDPYFQYRFTEYLTNTGVATWFDSSNPSSWLNWHDYQRWYPYGANVPSLAYPGLPMTASFLYQIVRLLGIDISLKYFCILFPAFFGTLAVLIIYFLGKDIGGKGVGILSALFLALNPSFISRVSLGFFDDESNGIVAILLFALFFLRTLDKERPTKSAALYMIASGLTLGYITAGWGASLYPIAMTTLFVFTLIVLRRYSTRLLLSYSITFGIGLFVAIHVPKLGLGFLFSSSILPVFGVFLLLLLCEILQSVQTARWKVGYTALFFAVLIGGVVLLSQLGMISSPVGKFISVLNPFERLQVPLIESVQEHRVTAWGTIYYDYGIGVIFFLVGMFFIIGNLTNRNLFLAIYGLTGLYFASSMVRLTVLLAPAFCILWAIGVTGLIKPFLTIVHEAPKISVGRKQVGRVGKEFSGVVVLMIFLLLTLTIALPFPRVFNHAYTPTTIASDSIGFATPFTLTDWIDALAWMRTSLPPNSVICSWWDYGYWITVEGNQTSLADNATFNTTQIALIGAVFMSNETQAIKILKEQLGKPDYILVFCTFQENSQNNYPEAGYGDEGKWRWMAKIAGDFTFAKGNDAVFGNYSLGQDKSQSAQTTTPNKVGQNTTIYKLMYYVHDRVLLGYDKSTVANNQSTSQVYMDRFIKDGSETYYFEEVGDKAGFFPATLPGYNIGVDPIVAIYKINYPKD